MLKPKRAGEISQIEIFNLNLYKKKSYYMNFKLLIKVTNAFNSYFYIFKVHVI